MANAYWLKSIWPSFSFFSSGGDEGRGLAVVTSLRSLDREAKPTRLLPLVVGDARGLTATVTVTVTITDVNDNLMTPAAKVVSVTRITVRTLF